MWQYGVWSYSRDDWHLTDDGAIWTTGRLADASAMAKRLKRAVVLNVYVSP